MVQSEGDVRESAREQAVAGVVGHDGARGVRSWAQPAAVLRATVDPPCSYSSGISVSAKDAMTPPAANANGRDRV